MGFTTRREGGEGYFMFLEAEDGGRVVQGEVVGEGIGGGFAAGFGGAVGSVVDCDSVEGGFETGDVPADD